MSTTYLVGEQTKRIILKESRKLFYKYGFAETTYNDISSAADINRALIPYHFKTKQDLGQIILAQIERDFLIHLDTIVEIEQYIPEFIYILHRMAICRLLTNEKYRRFAMQIHDDSSYAPDAMDLHIQNLQNLGTKTAKLDNATLSTLAYMAIGMERETIRKMCDTNGASDPDTLVGISMHMLLEYIGFSKKKIGDLIEIAVDLLDSYTFKVKNGFSIEIKEK